MSIHGPILLMKCWTRYASLRDRLGFDTALGVGKLSGGEATLVLPTGNVVENDGEVAFKLSSCRRLSSSMDAGDEKSRAVAKPVV